MKSFGQLMSMALALIISAIINGFVFSMLWMWFIVPTFQMRPLRVVEAIGIILLINFVRAKRDEEGFKDNFWENFKREMIFVVLWAGFTLYSSWVVTLFL